MANREQVVLNGRYELQRRVGRGGMAEVYLARDRLLDRPVAIKILFPEFATDPSFVARFRREAQSAANLSHPNIVGVYDWGKERGTYYIVMEFVDGRSVSDLLRADGPIDPKRAAGIAAAVAAALGFAHRKGVVHRDVKPGNILITDSGDVKVADFGIARALTASSEDNLTQTGSVMGTATYFSPEQAQGKPVDPRTDLYSLGVVLYEMAAGKPPFAGDSPVAIAYKHVQEQPEPLHDRAPGVPTAYEAITAKAMAKDPDGRYPDGEAMRADLLRFREGRPVQAVPAAALAPAQAEPLTVMAPAVPASAAAPASRTTVSPPAPMSGSAPVVVTEVDDGEGRHSGWFFAAIVALLAVLAVLLFFVGKQLGIFEDQVKQVTVPLVTGQSVSEAQSRLEARGLKSKVARTSSSKPKDEVLGQDPKQDQVVDKGSTVTLIVSNGSVQATVPGGLVGKKELAARLLLVEAGFSEGAIRSSQEPGDSEAGTVLRVDPEPGSYPRTQEITLIVSDGSLATTTTETPTTATPTPSTTTSSTTTSTTTTTTTAPTTTTSTPPTTTTSTPPTTTSGTPPTTTSSTPPSTASSTPTTTAPAGP